MKISCIVSGLSYKSGYTGVTAVVWILKILGSAVLPHVAKLGLPPITIFQEVFGLTRNCHHMLPFKVIHRKTEASLDVVM